MMYQIKVFNCDYHFCLNNNCKLKNKERDGLNNFKSFM